MSNTRATVLVAVLLGMVLSSGCARGPTRDPAFAATYPVPQSTKVPLYGSVYENGRYMTLFSDIKAFQVGDVLTVQLEEETDATKKADTEITQETDFDMDNATVFGMTPNIGAGRLSDDDITLENTFQSDREFTGETESEQSNSLKGDITVTVSQVLANGNLVVQGEKLMTLNRGHEHIRFSGIVRPYDITAENTVPSTKVADATIVYAGEGELADANRTGWWGRLFLKFSPY